MTTTTTSTVVQFAGMRDEADTSSDAAVTTLRAIQRGNATAADRKARNLQALQVAGLVGRITPVPVAGLKVTAQRAEVLADLLDGLSYNEMAAKQHRNVDTVKKHCANLYRMFGVSSRVECVVEAVRAGVLPAPAKPRAPRARRQA